MKQIKLKINCIICKKDVVFKVPKQGYEDWRNGIVIQKAMPKVSLENREMFLSKICPSCWPK